MNWNALERSELKSRVFDALAANKNYHSEVILGLPGTYLDTAEFYRDAPFLDDAPYLSTLVANPNHIGCHTLNRDESEQIFRGTQRLEIELLDLISEEIFKADLESVDGYIAAGGTEANIQAMWIYRNYFIQKLGVPAESVGLVFSSDSHYSMMKGANLLQLKPIVCAVDEVTRQWDLDDLHTSIQSAKLEGVSNFIVVANMGTTMFGSVDDIDALISVFKEARVAFKLHIDAAFGGFIYPFIDESNPINFAHPAVNSITLDAHKMLQAPFGTGIFLIRKGWMHYAGTKEAQYVPGLDYTLVGSRSGANVVAIWMILMTHGSEGWKDKLRLLIDLTDACCERLQAAGITFYRNPNMNIITISAASISNEVAERYRLVADTYEGEPSWWKIVVMPHVKETHLMQFIDDVIEDRQRNNINE